MKGIMDIPHLLTRFGTLLNFLLILNLTEAGHVQYRSPTNTLPPEDPTALEKPYEIVRYQPRHVHISYGDLPTEMVVTWSTIDSISPFRPAVEFGFNSISQHKAFGTSKFFQDAGSMNLTQYIHRVKLENLTLDTTYIYHCGSDSGWSDLYFFKTMESDPNWAPQFAIFGDMGNENAKSLTRLQKEVHLDMYDAIIHAGDFAYDMDSDNGTVGDSFMDQIQSIAAYVPYMTCPGNHEYRNNFLHYKGRFTMPGKFDSLYYSWNVGPIHFISLSTEVYYYLQYGLKPLIQQYTFLEKDLAEANKPENRAKRPWIIAYGHRPMYCSNSDGDDCTNHETLVRVGVPLLHWFGLEDLFMRHGVDLTIWAHEHSYERLWPIYNRKVYNGSYDKPYKNPKSITHIITGSAGCAEIHDHFQPNQPDWSAFRSLDYGYSRLKALNSTHLYFEQVSDDQDGKIIDSFTLIRERHEPFPIPPHVD